MTKYDLRKKYSALRKTLSEDEVLSYSQKISYNFSEKFKLTEEQKVHCFLSISDKNEIDTQSFLKSFFKSKIRVFVPKIYRNKMISVEINQKTALSKNAWGIPEPESNEDSGEKDFDFVLVPLLYCDHHGNRVGYGKGFYDYFFRNINPNCVKIGLNFFNPNEKIDDVWENDVPLDYLVTPTEVLSFGGATSKLTK